MFCGANCLGRVKELVHRFYAGLETCKMFVRGHIGVYDYREGLKAVQGGKPSDVIWITMLRDPVKRVISEFVHVCDPYERWRWPRAGSFIEASLSRVVVGHS